MENGCREMDVEVPCFYLPDLLRRDLGLCTPQWQRTGSRPSLVWSGEAPGPLCLSPCVCAKRDGGGGRAPVALSPCVSLPLQRSIVRPPYTRGTPVVSVPPTSCPHCPLPLGLPVHTPPVGIKVQRESLKWCPLDGVVSKGVEGDRRRPHWIWLLRFITKSYFSILSSSLILKQKGGKTSLVTWGNVSKVKRSKLAAFPLSGQCEPVL